MKIQLADLRFPEFSFYDPGVSQGLLSTFCKCRVAFLIKMNRYKRIGKKTSYRGTLFHDFLLKYFQFIKERSLPELTDIKRAYTRSLHLHKKEFDEMYINDDELEQSIQILEVIALGYITHWGKIDLKKKIIKPEYEFTVPYSGYNRVGKIDLIYQSADTNQLDLMEHKLKGRIDEGIEEALPLDLQCLFYTTSISKDFDQPCFKIVYDIIRNPSSGKKERKKKINLKQLISNLNSKIKHDREHYYIRIPHLFTKKEQVVFDLQVQAKVNEMKDLMAGKLQVYRNEASCHTGYYCDHINTCVTNILNSYKQSNKFYTELEGGDKYGD